MATRITSGRTAYSTGGGSVQMAALPIVAGRNPTVRDFAALGTIWVNEESGVIYMLGQVSDGEAIWQTSPASGIGIFTSVDITTGDLDVQAGGSTTTISSGTVNFDNAAGTVTMANDLTVVGTTTLNGDIDITSASLFNVTVTSNTDPAILLQTNGGTTETIQVINTQGTSADAIDIRATDGDILISTTNSTDAAAIALTSNAGGIQLSSALAAADAISLESSDAAGGIVLHAGTSGIAIGNQVDCTTIDIGDIAPTASRTVSISGGTVITAATTDTLDLAPDGATTNANSIKTVNVNTGGVAVGEVLTNIASGAVTSGTHTVNVQTGNVTAGTVAMNVASGAVTSGTHTVSIQTGAVTAGTVATNVSTGTGTKTINAGNADGLTTLNIDGITLINNDINVLTSINTGSSTGGVTIGNAAAGNIAIDTAGTVLIDADGVVEINSSAGVLSIGNDDNDFGINVGSVGERPIVVGNVVGATDISLDAGTGGIDINSVNGNVTVTVGKATVAGVALTNSARVSQSTFSAQTTAAAADQVFTITNTFVSTTNTVFVSASNDGAADAQMTIHRVKQLAGSIEITLTNEGAASLNGNCLISIWVMD